MCREHLLFLIHLQDNLQWFNAWLWNQTARAHSQGLTTYCTTLGPEAYLPVTQAAGLL